MKGFDYAKKVFCRVPPACCCLRSRPVVRQLLKLLMNLVSAQLRCINGFDRRRIDRGEISGLTSRESVELARAKRRIRELELEVEILRRASKILGAEHPDPKGFTR